MHLTKMRFGKVPPFTEPIEVSFNEQVNVFVGANATGKSRVLLAMDEFLNPKPERATWPMTREQLDLKFRLGENDDYSDEWAQGRNLLSADRDFNNAYYRQHPDSRPPVIYIGPTRIGLPGVLELEKAGSFGSTVEEVLAGDFSGARLNASIDMMSEKAREMFDQEKQSDIPTSDRRA